MDAAHETVRFHPEDSVDRMIQYSYAYERGGFRRGLQTFRYRPVGGWNMTTSNNGEIFPWPLNWALA